MPERANVRADSLLSNFSLMYRNDAFIAEEVLGRAGVADETGLYYTFDQKHLIRQNGRLRRADAGPYERGDWSGSKTQYTCEELGFEIPIGDRARKAAQLPINMDRDTTQRATDVVLLEQELQAAALLFSTTNFAGYTTTLSGTDQWSDHTSANSNPLEDAETARSSIIQTCFHKPNVLVVGQAVDAQLRTHPQVQESVKYTQGKPPSNENMAAFFGVDRYLVGSGAYNSAMEGQTAVAANIWGKYALFMYQAPGNNLTTQTMTCAMRIVSQDRKVERYREDDIKADIIRVSQIQDLVVCAAGAGYLFAGAVA